MTLHSTLGLATRFAFRIIFMMAAGTTWPLCLLARQPPCCLLVTMTAVEQHKSFHYVLRFSIWTPGAPSDWAEAVLCYLTLNPLRVQCASSMWYPQNRLTIARPFESSAEKMTPTGQQRRLPCCLYPPQWCSHPHLIIPLQSCPL